MKLLGTKFNLRSSISLAAIFLFIHVGAIFCVCFSMVLWVVKITSVPCILTNLIFMMRKYVFLNSKNSVVEFESIGEGGWYLQLFSGENIATTIKPPLFVSNYLIIINFIERGLVVPIFKDSLSKDCYRSLKVLLKRSSL
jgi:hypothetical protein